MEKSFAGKVALVTGGGAGIGRASALAFAREGARVVVADRQPETGEQTAKLIREAGGEALFVRADMSRREDIEAMVAGAAESWGRLDVALNNAGIEGTIQVPADRFPEQSWDEVININLKGVWLSMKYEIPQLLRQKGSAIVNVASVAGMSGSRMSVAYHASKHGVVGLTRAAAIEYASQGLRVNAVAPAVIRTSMAERAFLTDPTMEGRVSAIHPIGRIGTPEEVAAAVVWLCSEASSFVTGHVLAVDGGFLAQ